MNNCESIFKHLWERFWRFFLRIFPIFLQGENEMNIVKLGNSWLLDKFFFQLYQQFKTLKIFRFADVPSGCDTRMWCLKWQVGSIFVMKNKVNSHKILGNWQFEVVSTVFSPFVTLSPLLMMTMQKLSIFLNVKPSKCWFIILSGISARHYNCLKCLCIFEKKDRLLVKFGTIVSWSRKPNSDLNSLACENNKNVNVFLKN